VGIEISSSQQKRVEKIARLREYFGNDCPEIYEWSVEDERLDFKLMSDYEVSEYLKAAL
jgi:hypothetical protein